MITLTKEEVEQLLDALNGGGWTVKDYAVELLRARLAQPEPKPVAYLRRKEFAFGYEQVDREDHGAIPVYTAPPQRKWQGLTDDEMSETYNVNYDIYKEHVEYVDFFLIYRAIEAKLKEKNA